MNTFIKTTALATLLTVVAPMASHASAVKPTEPSTKLDPAQVTKLENRLIEIKAMDISKLNRQEKRTLRKEVKAIEKQMDNGGVYVSVGAIIIIVLLLILIL
ncbi:MAG: hypothetical protein O9262_15020 [Cyclobacteriaceae bacterium]|nr:hypothetical protein [Cyclobacteriaceae bacterium]